MKYFRDGHHANNLFQIRNSGLDHGVILFDYDYTTLIKAIIEDGRLLWRPISIDLRRTATGPDRRGKGIRISNFPRSLSTLFQFYCHADSRFVRSRYFSIL